MIWHLLLASVGGSRRLAEQDPVEHEVRIRIVKEEPPVYGWAYFTYLARLIAVDTPKRYHALSLYHTFVFGKNDVSASNSDKSTLKQRYGRASNGEMTTKQRQKNARGKARGNMAKTLSERIADRMRNKKTSVSAQNRGAFLALKAEISQAIADGWAVKSIWETLHEEGKVTFSYQAFRNYVNGLILAPKRDTAAKALPEPPPARNKTGKQTNTVPAGPSTPASKISPVTPPKPAGFTFDAKPKKEDYL